MWSRVKLQLRQVVILIAEGLASDRRLFTLERRLFMQVLDEVYLQFRCPNALVQRVAEQLLPNDVFRGFGDLE